MDDILETTLLEYEKSAFLIELIQHQSGIKYVRLLQTIHEEKDQRVRAIKINPSLLSDIVRVLNLYSGLIGKPQKTKSLRTEIVRTTHSQKSLTELEKKAIQNRYLKGVSISDLTLQFDCKKELIEQILRNNGIAIVNNEIPKTFHPKRRRWKKR